MATIRSLNKDILHLIINIIHSSNDIPTLKSLSVVFKECLPRLRIIIFRKFTLHPDNLPQIYSEKFKHIDDAASSRQLPPAFDYVENLCCSGINITGNENCMKILKLFTQVKSLKINSWHPKYLKSLDMDGLLKHFARTVTSLELVHCTLNSSGLIYLLSPFHRINNLLIKVTGCTSKILDHEIVDYDLSGCTLRFRGNLDFELFNSADHKEFLAFVNERSEDVSSISVRWCEKDEELERLFKVPKNLLSICVGSYVKENVLDLSSCARLKNLSIYLRGAKLDARDIGWDYLRTVNPSNLEEINVHELSPKVAHIVLRGWEEIDDLLCQWYKGSCARVFRIRLHPLSIPKFNLQDHRDQWMHHIQRAWPRFFENRAEKRIILTIESEKGLVIDITPRFIA